MATINVVWPAWKKIINTTFIPLVNNKDRYLILYGSRGSGKSDFASKKLIHRCLTEKYFRCVLVRKTYTTIKDSSYMTIKDNIIKMGLDSLFDFKVSPLEIVCKNGNKFLCRGCDDTSKLKSIKDPTCIYWEEDIPSEEDFITVTTSVRTQQTAYLQEIFTINPEVEGNYQDHWFYRKFFNRPEKSFSDSTEIIIDDNNKANVTYTVHKSTWRDNRWIGNEFKAFLLDLKRTNPYYYDIYSEGDWSNMVMGGLFWKKFNRAKNTQDIAYDPSLALHCSFDFNVIPYSTCVIFQIKDKQVYCIDEITLSSPKNNTRSVCQEIVYRYMSHQAGLFIYGDPSGRNRSTRDDEGYNDYTIIENELVRFHPESRVATKHPPIVARGNFINKIFEDGFEGINLFIDNKCIYMINDLLFTKESADGTTFKEKESKHGVTYEKYCHLGDALSYMMCSAFNDEFRSFQSGPEIDIMFGGNDFNPAFRF